MSFIRSVLYERFHCIRSKIGHKITGTDNKGGARECVLGTHAQNHNIICLSKMLPYMATKCRISTHTHTHTHARTHTHTHTHTHWVGRIHGYKVVLKVASCNLRRPEMLVSTLRKRTSVNAISFELARMLTFR